MRALSIDLHRFPDDGSIPNNPNYPLILYRSARVDGDDLAAEFEAMFSENHWQGSWRNGIYPFHHYHSTAHEILGIASGSVRVLLGGEGGAAFDLTAGDAVLIPAGVGHKRLSQSADLLVVGAYPAGQDCDLVRSTDAVDADKVRATIATVPRPATDPIAGKDGPLTRLWTKPT